MKDRSSPSEESLVGPLGGCFWKEECPIMQMHFKAPLLIRGGSRTAATSKVELFVILDPPLPRLKKGVALVK